MTDYRDQVMSLPKVKNHRMFSGRRGNLSDLYSKRTRKERGKA